MADTALGSARAWWATSSRSARATMLGAIVLVILLTAVAAVVWVSPISPVTQVGRAVGELTGRERLIAQRDRLVADTARLQTKLNRANGELARSGFRTADLRAQVSALSARLAETSAQIDALEGRLAATGSSSAGRSSSASGSSRTPAGRAPVAPIVTPTKEQIIAPQSPYFGLYTEQAPFNWASFDQTARNAGSLPSSVGFFAGWDQPYRASGVVRAWQRGMLPVMTWESRPINAPNNQKDDPNYTLQKILDGGFDDYIRQFARDVKTTGLPVAIRLDHEMNGAWYPWSELTNTNRSGQYVQMWRKVWDIFQAEGANQYAVWLWSPNRINRLKAQYASVDYTRSLYPGDQYVDWVGMSGYYRAYSPAETASFDATFGPTLAQLRAIAPAKRIFLSEVGATEIGGQKPTWTASFFRGINDPANADIVGFGWFNLVVTSFADADTNTNDFRLDATSQSRTAFAGGLAAPGSRFVVRPMP